jgi:hypothetical protein
MRKRRHIEEHMNKRKLRKVVRKIGSGALLPRVAAVAATGLVAMLVRRKLRYRADAHVAQLVEPVGAPNQPGLSEAPAL